MAHRIVSTSGSGRPVRTARLPARWRLIAAAVLIPTAGCSPPEGPEARARRLVAEMDTRARAAQIIVASLDAEDPAAGGRALTALAARGEIGGIWVSGGDGLQIASAVQAAQSVSTVPLLVASTLDGGAPVDGATELPPAAMIAARAAPEDARVAGSVAASEAAAVGVRLGFLAAPPMNDSGPLAFTARDPAGTAAGLAELVEGAGASGVGVGVISFWAEAGAAPLLAWDRARIEAVELRILRPLLETGLEAVALGAVRLPALTGDSLPVSLSPAATRGLLRRQLGFTGILAGDLGGDAPLVRELGETEAAVRLVESGHHLLVRVRDPAAVTSGIVEAVANGRLAPATLQAAASEALALRLRTAERPATTPDSVRRLLRAPAAVALAERLARLAAAPALPAPAPVLRLSPHAAAGMDSARLVAVDALLLAALEDSVFTGAALAVGRHGAVARLSGYGAEIDPRRTLFDIASLTKVVGTTTAVGILVDRGVMHLDEPVRTYLPEWGADGDEEVTIRHLLTHTSGLPAGLWLFGSARSRMQAIEQAISQPLTSEPGERVLYSDLGMILLAEAVEHAAGEPIDLLLARQAFAPLGMQHTMFLPPMALASRSVPTAETTERDFTLRGIVHDANAFRLDGVTGHAGLFSTARDLAVFAQMILNGGAYSTTRILTPETVALFTAKQSGAENRAIGWDTPADRSSAGRYLSSRAFGHTGYTGTSLWIDPDLDLFVVLLTNRTFTGAPAADILRLRAAVHEAVAQAIADTTVQARPGSRAVR